MAVKVTRRVIRSCTSAMDWGVGWVSGRREWTKKPNAALAHGDEDDNGIDGVLHRVGPPLELR